VVRIADKARHDSLAQPGGHGHTLELNGDDFCLRGLHFLDLVGINVELARETANALIVFVIEAIEFGDLLDSFDGAGRAFVGREIGVEDVRPVIHGGGDAAGIEVEALLEGEFPLPQVEKVVGLGLIVEAVYKDDVSQALLRGIQYLSTAALIVMQRDMRGAAIGNRTQEAMLRHIRQKRNPGPGFVNLRRTERGVTIIAGHYRHTFHFVSRESRGPGDLVPNPESFVTDLSILCGREQMATRTEMRSNAVYLDKALGMPRGFEPSHAPLALTRRLMRVLGSVV
jgi:hypothetical protein